MLMIKHDINRKMMASRKIAPLQLFLFELIVVFCSLLSLITNDWPRPLQYVLFEQPFVLFFLLVASI